MIMFLLVSLGIAIIASAFVLQNPMPVMVVFLSWQFPISLGLALVLTLSLGVIAAILFLAPALISRTWTISAQRKKIHRLEKNNQELTLQLTQLTTPGVTQTMVPMQPQIPTIKFS